MTSDNFLILHQDEAILVVEKLSGIPSCGQGSIEESIQKNFPSARLVHRLDNNTSGLLVAAKTDNAFEKLRAVWSTPQVVKKYIALVLGKTPLSGVIDTPIAHHPRKKKKMMPGGKKARPAHTEYKTIQHFKNVSLLEVQITTGVRHQIRIHMASIGHPIAGDKLYQKTKHRAQDTFLGSKHFLHLSEIQFPHPLTGKIFTCKSTPSYESFIADSDRHSDLL